MQAAALVVARAEKGAFSSGEAARRALIGKPRISAELGARFGGSSKRIGGAEQWLLVKQCGEPKNQTAMT